MSHTFHIPVLGLAYTVDTPLKVAKFGLNSVVSIIQDELLEFMREFHAKENNLVYQKITNKDFDYRANRITAYLNLMNDLVQKQIENLKTQKFEFYTDLTKYFEMLPETSFKKQLYNKMIVAKGTDKLQMQHDLKNLITGGSIDVNIMTKIDNIHYTNETRNLDINLFSDAQAALRGFALSKLSSSLVLSAGLNPRLFSYMETFKDFFPNKLQQLKKRIIIKVSDFRSALVQGKILAKKGIWVSEFRIESGLNCGGHAFPTDGNLLGPVLEEFKLRRTELNDELTEIVNASLIAKNCNLLHPEENIKISVQGGIGTAQEDAFLRNYYGVDYTGWGSPFLLVPEATNVDAITLNNLANAARSDYYLSYASPLGVPFNNFKQSTSEKQRLKRIESGKPGSPCFKKHLSFNTEFGGKALCTASRKFQHLKIKELRSSDLQEAVLTHKINQVIEKDCLCEGLTATALLKNNLTIPYNLTAVAICPGPNLAYFSGVFTLKEMVNHIYGRTNKLNKLNRLHMFLNEIDLYINYLKAEIKKNCDKLTDKQIKYFLDFKNNLLVSINYYYTLPDKLELNEHLYDRKLMVESIKI